MPRPIKSMSTKSWKRENSMQITFLKYEHKTEKCNPEKREKVLLNPLRIPTSWWQRKTYKRPDASPPFSHWVRRSKEQPLRWLKVDNILIHKYIKTYLKIIRILCNRLKNNRIKQRSTVIKIRKRNKTYYQTDMNLTKISNPKPPTKNQLNHETEMKTRLKTLVLQAYRKPENACTVPKTYVRQKGRLHPKPLFKVFFPQRKSIYFLKTKHLFLT